MKKENAAQIAIDMAEAMNDLLMSPMGVIPQSADWLYDGATGTFDARKIFALLADLADARRATQHLAPYPPK